MKKIFKDLSVLDGKGFSYFKTISTSNNKIYEVIVLDKYEYGVNAVYVKYPNDNHFTELYGSAFSSSGYQKYGTFSNPWELDYEYKPKSIKIKYEDDFLFIDFGITFSFLKKVPPLPLSGDILTVPLDVWSVSYSYKTEQGLNMLCVSPTYDFNYDSHRFFTFANGFISELKIKDFQRFRDGGTTKIELVSDDNTRSYTFYSPTPFLKDVVATWTSKENGIYFTLIKHTP